MSAAVTNTDEMSVAARLFPKNTKILFCGGRQEKTLRFSSDIKYIVAAREQNKIMVARSPRSGAKEMLFASAGEFTESRKVKLTIPSSEIIVSKTERISSSAISADADILESIY